jgi:cyclic pyranopterin phosphate synthase
VRIVRIIHERSTLDSVRVTGGEPLLYPPLPELIAEIKGAGIGRVTVTTNGFLLKKRLPELLHAGLDAVNISLDATTRRGFEEITGGRSLSGVVEGIDAAAASGLLTRINSTIMRGMNDSEILPLLCFAKERGVTLRYIELMSMGPLRGDLSARIVTKDEIVKIIESEYPVWPIERSPGETAQYYDAGGYRFGIIQNASDPFCRDCDRLRLDSQGVLYGCLSDPVGQRIENPSGEEMDAILLRALAQKQRDRFLGSDLSMKHIGG